jgi:hypothetical protein
MNIRQYNELVDQAAHALKDNAKKDAGILMRGGPGFNYGGVEVLARRDDTSSRTDFIATPRITTM